MYFWQEEGLERYYAMRQSKNNVEINLLAPHSKLFMCFLFTTDEAGQQDVEMCVFCRQTPCITTDSLKYLGFRAAHMQNHVRRRKD